MLVSLDTGDLSNRCVIFLIPRIYIVNPRGELKNEGTGVVSSYPEHVRLLDQIFPPL